VCCPLFYECQHGACVLAPPTCPAGTNCNGPVTCGSYTTEGICCQTPERAVCACDSAPGKGDGFALCCVYDGPGANCPDRVMHPTDNNYAVSGYTWCSDDPHCQTVCAGDGKCCKDSSFANPIVITCPA
jgi:hypothetical protein